MARFLHECITRQTGCDSGVYCLLLVALTLALYWPVHRFGFVNYDDPVYVTLNPQVQKGLSWEGVAWAFAAEHPSNWHPLSSEMPWPPPANPRKPPHSMRKSFA